MTAGCGRKVSRRRGAPSGQTGLPESPPGDRPFPSGAGQVPEPDGKAGSTAMLKEHAMRFMIIVKATGESEAGALIDGDVFGQRENDCGWPLCRDRNAGSRLRDHSGAVPGGGGGVEQALPRSRGGWRAKRNRAGGSCRKALLQPGAAYPLAMKKNTAPLTIDQASTSPVPTRQAMLSKVWPIVSRERS